MIEVVLVQDHRRGAIVAHQIVEAETDVAALVQQLQRKYPGPRYATVVAMAPSAAMLGQVYPPYADAAEDGTPAPDNDEGEGDEDDGEQRGGARATAEKADVPVRRGDDDGPDRVA